MAGNLYSSTTSFIREKTKRTTKGNPINVTAVRNAHINRILTKWSKEPLNREDYVFNIIDELGHTNILTTQKYLGGFDLAVYKKALTDF